MLFAMAEHLELPRPWRLILTAGWNLAESLGIPVAGYFLGAQLGGRDLGMLAATGVVWLTVVGRKVITHSVPGLLTISALVLTLQAAVVIVAGSLLFFLLQFPLANLGLCVLFARPAPARQPLGWWRSPSRPITRDCTGSSRARPGCGPGSSRSLPRAWRLPWRWSRSRC